MNSLYVKSDILITLQMFQAVNCLDFLAAMDLSYLTQNSHNDYFMNRNDNFIEQ